MYFSRIAPLVILVAAFPSFLVAQAMEPDESPSEPIYYGCVTFCTLSGNVLENTGNWLNTLADEEDKACYRLPEKVDPEHPIMGGTFTDGNHLYATLVLTLKKDEVSTEEALAQDENFKNQIRANAVFGSLFSDMEMSIHSENEAVLVFSDNFSVKDEAQIESVFTAMGEYAYDILNTECFIGFIEHYPWRKLYGNLPEESEHDGLFRKVIREKTPRSTPEGDNSLKAKIYGLSWDEHRTVKLFLEYVAQEGTPCAERYQAWNTKKPFRLGGFCNDESQFQLAYRYDTDSFSSNFNAKNPKFIIHSGTSVIPIDQREEINPSVYHHRLSPQIISDFSLDDLDVDEKIVFETDQVIFTIPIQCPDLPEEEGVPTAEMMDQINVEFARSFEPLACDIAAFMETLLEKEGEPLDVVLGYEDDLYLFACTLPEEKNPFRLTSFMEIPEAIKAMIVQTPNPYREPRAYDDLEFPDIRLTDNVETWNDTRFMEIVVTAFGQKMLAVIGVHPEMLCLAIVAPTADEADRDSRLDAEKFAHVTGRLKGKIEKSRELEAENARIPETICAWNHESTRLTLTNKTEGLHSRYVLKMNFDAMPRMMAIAKTILPMIP